MSSIQYGRTTCRTDVASRIPGAGERDEMSEGIAARTVSARALRSKARFRSAENGITWVYSHVPLLFITRPSRARWSGSRAFRCAPEGHVTGAAVRYARSHANPSRPTYNNINNNSCVAPVARRTDTRVPAQLSSSSPAIAH